MIRQCRNAFPCNVMQTNKCPDRLCQVKSHVKTASESHDLKNGLLRLQTASSNEFLCKKTIFANSVI